MDKMNNFENQKQQLCYLEKSFVIENAEFFFGHLTKRFKICSLKQLIIWYVICYIKLFFPKAKATIKVATKP